jgi:hypothetical protein
MVMRALCASLLFLVALSAASASDLKIKVVDPQSAAVAGAQVTLFVDTLFTSPGAQAGTYEGVITPSVKTATTNASN